MNPVDKFDAIRIKLRSLLTMQPEKDATLNFRMFILAEYISHDERGSFFVKAWTDFLCVQSTFLTKRKVQYVTQLNHPSLHNSRYYVI